MNSATDHEAPKAAIVEKKAGIECTLLYEGVRQGSAGDVDEPGQARPTATRTASDVMATVPKPVAPASIPEHALLPGGAYIRPSVQRAPAYRTHALHSTCPNGSDM